MVSVWASRTSHFPGNSVYTIVKITVMTIYRLGMAFRHFGQ